MCQAVQAAVRKQKKKKNNNKKKKHRPIVHYIVYDSRYLKQY